MLAEITLDMTAIGGWLKQALMVVLAVVGFFMFGIPLIVGKLKSMLKPVVPAPPALSGASPQVTDGLTTIRQLDDMLKERIAGQLKGTAATLPSRSSDQKPPSGFVEHMQIIQESAPNADPSVWWGYALKGLTSAEVSRAEAKLARLDGNVEVSKFDAPLVENEA